MSLYWTSEAVVENFPLASVQVRIVFNCPFVIVAGSVRGVAIDGGLKSLELDDDVEADNSHGTFDRLCGDLRFGRVDRIEGKPMEFGSPNEPAENLVAVNPPVYAWIERNAESGRLPPPNALFVGTLRTVEPVKPGAKLTPLARETGCIVRVKAVGAVGVPKALGRFGMLTQSGQ